MKKKNALMALRRSTDPAWPTHWSDAACRVVRESTRLWRDDDLDYPVVDPEADGDPPPVCATGTPLSPAGGAHEGLGAAAVALVDATLR